MPSIKLPTGSVHYTEHGQGVPLVLLHANPGDSKDFEAVVPALSKTYRVLALDWPGYGQSAPPQQPELVGVLFFYQVLREFLATLALPPAFFIGNSLGGNAAARLALCKSVSQTSHSHDTGHAGACVHNTGRSTTDHAQSCGLAWLRHSGQRPSNRCTED